MSKCLSRIKGLEEEQLQKCFMIRQRSATKTVHPTISQTEDLLSIIGFEKR